MPFLEEAVQALGRLYVGELGSRLTIKGAALSEIGSFDRLFLSTTTTVKEQLLDWRTLRVAGQFACAPLLGWR